MVDDLLGVALFHHHTAIHKQDAVSHIAGKLHLMRHDDHGGLVLGQIAQDPQHLARQFGVEGRGRLVKAEDVRLQGQGAGNGHALLLPAGKLVRVMPRPVGKPHLGQ